MVHLSAGVGFLLIWLLVCLVTASSGNSNNVHSVIDSRGLKVEMECDEEGLCMNCDKSEMHQLYCKETGRKIRTVCTDPRVTGREIDEYRACSTTAEDDQIRVIIFQVVMALLGGAAYYVVQDRKQKLMTLYDNRKLSANASRRMPIA